MHPLAVWLISSSQLRERDNEDRLMRRQREARSRQVAIARDGRWAAAMHRWAAQDEAHDRAQGATAQGTTEQPATTKTTTAQAQVVACVTV
jgi:hypothetical protein